MEFRALNLNLSMARSADILVRSNSLISSRSAVTKIAADKNVRAPVHGEGERQSDYSSIMIHRKQRAVSIISISAKRDTNFAPPVLTK